MNELWTVTGAALVVGFLGSAHCVGMCAGISGLFAAKAGAASIRADLPMAVAYNVGRVLSYAILGSIVAAVSAAFVDIIPQLAGPVRLLGGALIILVGLQVAFRWRLLAPIENAGARLWNAIAPRGGPLFPVTSVARALQLGLIWGLLPCGLVYSALLIAASTTDPVHGTVVMVAFGFGTMPAMLATGLSAARVAGFASRNRIAAGLLIVILGVATLALPIQSLLGPATHAH
ncbi:MAG: sulfite exporter TauE/SafE family protein [Pseudomonadota bacterium]